MRGLLQGENPHWPSGPTSQISAHIMGFPNLGFYKH